MTVLSMRLMAVTLGLMILFTIHSAYGNSWITNLSNLDFGVAFIGLFALFLSAWGMFNFLVEKPDRLVDRLLDVTPTALGCLAIVASLIASKSVHFIWILAAFLLVTILVMLVERVNLMVGVRR